MRFGIWGLGFKVYKFRVRFYVDVWIVGFRVKKLKVFLC